MKLFGIVVDKEEIPYKEKKDANGKIVREAGIMYFIYFAPTRPKDKPYKVAVNQEHFGLYEMEKEYAFEFYQRVDRLIPDVINTRASAEPTPL